MDFVHQLTNIKENQFQVNLTSSTVSLK